MCGRFALHRALQQLRANLRANRVETNGHDFQPNNNIAPSDPAPVFTNNTIQVFVFGIQSTTHGTPLYNARSETVSEKFARDITTRRCVIPVDGYFEFDKTKQPFYFHKSDEELMFLAGFYTKNGEFVILTRDATKEAKRVHDRMPIILSESEIEMWESEKWAQLIGVKPPVLIFYPVAKYALRPGSHGEECIKKISQGGKQQLTMFDVFKASKKEKPKTDIKKLLDK